MKQEATALEKNEQLKSELQKLQHKFKNIKPIDNARLASNPTVNNFKDQSHDSMQHSFISVISELNFKLMESQKRYWKENKKNIELEIRLSVMLRLLKSKSVQRFNSYYKSKKEETKSKLVTTNSSIFPGNSHSDRIDSMLNTSYLENNSRFYTNYRIDEHGTVKQFIKSLLKTNERLVSLLTHARNQYLLLNKIHQDNPSSDHMSQIKKPRSLSVNFVEDLNTSLTFSGGERKFSLQAAKIYLKALHEDFESYIEEAMYKVIYRNLTFDQLLSSDRFKDRRYVQRRSISVHF